MGCVYDSKVERIRRIDMDIVNRLLDCPCFLLRIMIDIGEYLKEIKTVI